ncbi:hypothetical protein PS623_01554 [Pseudomonas fluorescens]|nr:hypothetical protein PS623_01554 [Pseudomonas fluorescens]
MGFVQGLGDVEGFLGAVAELLRADFLQGAQIERQWCGFAHALGDQLADLRTASRSDIGGGLLGQALVKAAGLIIAGVFRRAPLCVEQAAGMLKLHVDGPERNWHEVGDAAIAVYHQAQGRGLHTADGQHALITGLTPEQGEQPTHVHADQPVGTRTAQS